MIVKRVIVFALVIATACVLQGTLSSPISIHHARPDFLILALTCLALLTNPAQGVAAGFCGGLVTAVLSGINYGTFMVSRIAAGWVSGWIGRTMNREALLTPLAGITAATLVSQLIAFIMAPYNPVRWAGLTAGELAYNLVLMIPIYLVLQRIVRPRRTRDRFERKLYRRR